MYLLMIFGKIIKLKWKSHFSMQFSFPHINFTVWGPFHYNGDFANNNYSMLAYEHAGHVYSVHAHNINSVNSIIIMIQIVGKDHQQVHALCYCSGVLCIDTCIISPQK